MSKEKNIAVKINELVGLDIDPDNPFRITDGPGLYDEIIFNEQSLINAINLLKKAHKEYKKHKLKDLLKGENNE